MVEVEGGKDALARISIVNYYGQVYMDTFVKPNLKITDYRTWVSGVAPVHMDEKALPYETIRYIVHYICIYIYICIYNSRWIGLKIFIFFVNKAMDSVYTQNF